MTTFRQVDCFVARADMGSFDGAARRLGVAQSAVSRHVQEFEDSFDNALLEPRGRTAGLTVMGEQVLARCRVIQQHREALLAVLSSREIAVRRLRIGVTELIALTWLQRWLAQLRAEFPNAVLQLKVDLSTALREELRAGDLDFAVLPQADRVHGCTQTRLGAVENRWYAAPSQRPAGKVVRRSHFKQFTLLAQGALSRSGEPLAPWLQTHGIEPASVVSISSFPALVDLTAAGLGVSHLPSILVQDQVRRGALVELHVTPKTPDVVYVLVAPEQGSPRLFQRVLNVARSACDFAATPVSEASSPDARKSKTR